MARTGLARRDDRPDEAKAPDGRALQHRAHRRHYTTLRVAKIATESIEGLGLVRNVSSGGMMVDAKTQLHIDQLVTVSLFDGQQLDARVVWAKGGQVGLEFVSPVEVDDLLALPSKPVRGKTPRPPRLRVDRPAIIDTGCNTLSTITVCDLSQRGAKILIAKPLVRDQDVWLWLTGMQPLSGTVRWCGGGQAGIAFHERLGVNQLMAWLEADQAQDG